MADLTQQLADAGSLLHILGVPGSANPGQHLTIGLAPPLPTLTFTDVVPQAVSLDFIAKQVVFTNKNLADPNFVTDPNIQKILPLFNLGVVPPTVDTSGVPGLIGKLKGMFPVAVPTTEVPKMEVTWKITDDAGNALAQGTDFLAPGGLTSPALDVVFLPAFTRFDGAAPGTVGRKIIAHVKLSAGTATPWENDVGPARVEIPTIPFPKVLALTVDIDFQGPSLIMVPGPSPINGIDHIKALLQPVRNVISTLGGIARFAEMLTGIDTLAGVLDGTNVVFSKATTVNNLRDITLVEKPWYEPNLRAEDELSAFVYISPPPPGERSNDNKVEMCNARNLSTSEGKFTVNTGLSFVAICSNLHSAAPAVTPASAVSPPVLTVNNPPAGQRWFFHNITTFGDELSSINFL